MFVSPLKKRPVRYLQYDASVHSKKQLHEQAFDKPGAVHRKDGADHGFSRKDLENAACPDFVTAG